MERLFGLLEFADDETDGSKDGEAIAGGQFFDELGFGLRIAGQNESGQVKGSFHGEGRIFLGKLQINGGDNGKIGGRLNHAKHHDYG